MGQNFFRDCERAIKVELTVTMAQVFLGNSLSSAEIASAYVSFWPEEKTLDFFIFAFGVLLDNLLYFLCTELLACIQSVCQSINQGPIVPQLDTYPSEQKIEVQLQHFPGTRVFKFDPTIDRTWNSDDCWFLIVIAYVQQCEQRCLCVAPIVVSRDLPIGSFLRTENDFGGFTSELSSARS